MPNPTSSQAQQKAIWYYTVADQQKGPVTTSALIQLYKAGTIKSNTLIWRQGFTDWKPFSQFLKGSTAPGGNTASATRASGGSSLGKIIAIMAAAAVIVGGGAFAALHAIPSTTPATSKAAVLKPSSANSKNTFDTMPAGANSTANASSASSPSSLAAVSEGTPPGTSSIEPFVQEPFDPSGSVKPKVIPNDSVGGIEEIIDADGTQFFPGGYPLFINPDHSAFKLDDYNGPESHPGGEEMFFFVPTGKDVAGKGHGVTQYLITNENGGVNIDQSDTYYTDKQQYVEVREKEYKSQSIPSGMTIHDVMDSILPPKGPTKTVENHILNGLYEYVDKQIVGSTTPVTLSFLSQNYVVVTCTDTGLGGGFHYKLEPLGKNAYRLYLYKIATVTANQQKSTPDTLLDTPFFIYMDAQDKFDFVYFSDINRHSVTMTKSNTGG